MPIRKHSALLQLTTNVDQSPALKKRDPEKGKLYPELAYKMISVKDSYHELFFQTHNAVESETKKGLWHYLRYMTSWNRKAAEPEDIALNKILAKGLVLEKKAKKLTEQLQQPDELHPPPFSLKNKVGILLGSVILLAGCGAGFYPRRRQMNEGQENFHSENSLNKPGEAARNSTVKDNLVFLDIISDKVNIHKKRMASFIKNDKKPKKIYDNRYDLTDQTVQRCRARLLSYLYQYADVSEKTKNEQLAWVMLSLLSQNPIHKSWLARISLYRTGLFGEKKDESLSSNVQHQLVGNLLSLLLYDQSLEDHLISIFSKNRYISIKGFSEEIVKNDCQINSDVLSNEMNFFHENYLNPAIPVLSLKLREHSTLLVGSVTWFLVYLSSAAEGLEAEKYDETQAITQGIKILHHFVSGSLEEASHAKINLGLKFCALYFNTTLTPETLPEFATLWGIYRTEYIKYSNLSYNVETTIVKIINDIKDKDIENQPWDSENKFAEKILLAHCLKKYPFLFYIIDDERQRVSIREFINSTTERVWCIQRKRHSVTGAYESELIKLPIVKYQYQELLKNALDIINDINKLYLSVAFNKNDYFNAEMDWDDFDFINKSALKVVSLLFIESLFTKKNSSISSFKLAKSKKNFIFFMASYYGEKRIYAIDMTHKKPLQKVREEDEYIIKNRRVFFDVEYIILYKDMGIIIIENDEISISRQEPTSLFIEKLVNYQRKNLQEIIYKKNVDFLYLGEVMLESIKEILIPFYSCVTSIQKGDVSGATFNCLIDLAFIVLPTGRVIIKTTEKLAERMIYLGFMIQRNHVFSHGGRIYWRRVINDPYISNLILNERSMLKSVFLKLLINNLDPGIGLAKDISEMFKHMASSFIKGKIIHLSFVFFTKLKNIIEFIIRVKSLVDSSKKIIIKATRSSGRLAKGERLSTINNSNETFSFPLYDSAYQSGDYYAYYSNQDDIDLLIGVTEEKSEDDEFVYVILGEDEFQGVLFRFVFRNNEAGEASLVPWIPLEINAKRIDYSSRRNTTYGRQEITFNSDVKNPFNSIIYYPKHLCYLTGDGLLNGDVYEIYKINNSHYLFNSEGGYFRPLYDGDVTQVLDRGEGTVLNYIIKNSEGVLIIVQDSVSKFKSSSEYTFNSDDETRQEGMSLYYSQNELFLSLPKNIFKLLLTNIKSQFIINYGREDSPSFIVTWDSIGNRFIPAKPYLKKSSSHVGSMLESKVINECLHADALNKYPTLLLSGAVSCKSELKLRVNNYFYSLELSGNGGFYLKCNTQLSVKKLKLFYDLFTESYELSAEPIADVLPGMSILSPYDDLMSRVFPVKKEPEMIDLINLNSNDYNDKLKMRLHQAAFLQRLNPIDRMDVLLLPIAQIYSWELHRDTLPFQRLYPAAALWMTWQRQLHRLIKNKFPYRLKRVEKIRLQTENNKIMAANGLLMSSRYTDDEAIWISNDKKQQPLILYTSETGFSTKEFEINHGARQWIPVVRNSALLSVTQFMYEKDIHPKMTIIQGNRNIKLIDCHGDSERLYIEFDFKNREYFIISPGGEWAALIDGTHKVMIYNLREKKSRYLRNSKVFIQVSDSTTLLDFHPRNYHLLMLSDDGTLYYPEGSTWHDSNNNKHLWSPPKDFFPSFVSPDHRFIGFKNKDDFDVILYDQKRKLATLLKRPPGILYNGYITAVSFSALNAVVALAFNDGCVYLYDLISSRQAPSLHPIAYVKLNNIINGKEYNNIVIRFEGIFNTLTIIHSEGVWNSSSQVDEAVYIRSNYGFHHTVPQ